MIVRISSKHQVTIPNDIAKIFHFKKGDVMEVKMEGNRIILVPKEVTFEDKYPVADLEAADRVLSKGPAKEEVSFKSSKSALSYLKKRMKK